jgi:hypothetical protein
MAKCLFLERDATLTSAGHSMKIRQRAVARLFVLTELVGSGEPSLSQTAVAVGFPFFHTAAYT